jgi:hypothetical protein
MARAQDVHVGFRIPSALHVALMGYAVRHRISTSEALRRLLEGALKTSQRR